MATTKRSGPPEVWPSGIAGLLAGDRSCVLQAWLPAHFRIDKKPSTFDLGAWKVEHTDLVNRTVAKLKALDYACTVEDQNRFRLAGKSCVLVGKPDIVARHKNGLVRVVDAKTGVPMDSHGIQVAIYMLALPLVWERPTLVMEGQVAYRDHIVNITASEVQPIREKLFALLRQLGSSERPPAVPSEKGCAWCDVTVADCQQRFSEGKAVDVLTSEF